MHTHKPFSKYQIQESLQQVLETSMELQLINDSLEQFMKQQPEIEEGNLGQSCFKINVGTFGCLSTDKTDVNCFN